MRVVLLSTERRVKRRERAAGHSRQVHAFGFHHTDGEVVIMLAFHPLRQQAARVRFPFGVSFYSTPLGTFFSSFSPQSHAETARKYFRIFLMVRNQEEHV
jgi:hypothetical protein